MKREKEIYLSDYENFINIDNRYYGGNQKWLHMENYRKKFWSDRSCGVVAAANSLIYMSSHKSYFIGLYKYKDLSKGNFTKFANDLYKHIKPAIYGVHTLNKLSRGVESFAETQGFTIRSKKLSKPGNINSTIMFLNEGLKKDYPVLMLTWNSKIKNLNYHWVTITGYYKTVEGKYFIITSNWGKKQVFPLDDWLKDRSCYKGLLYFY